MAVHHIRTHELNVVARQEILTLTTRNCLLQLVASGNITVEHIASVANITDVMAKRTLRLVQNFRKFCLIMMKMSSRFKTGSVFPYCVYFISFFLEKILLVKRSELGYWGACTQNGI